ncbi:hypothetical protein AB0J80_38245 [Actinoplanes sp. NPDC049548]|uniref:hypothetical protein n=1 Tax=Actinoplanes sp. NPDC049548 TaxID=3155152 RepID=UPI003430D0A2
MSSRGSVPAFVALSDRIVDVARAEVAGFSGNARLGQVLAPRTSRRGGWPVATAPGIDATGWLTGIVRRRIDDALRGMTRQGMDLAAQGPRPSYSDWSWRPLLRRPGGDPQGA